jgi:glycerophosphoryl diester phosphodiesterase
MKNTLLIAAAVLLVTGWACQRGTGDHPTSYEFDLQGHRGARGLLPENSVPGFLLAVDLGVDTIEMDVVISADSQVVVSHEPWLSATICSHPGGAPVTEEEEHDLNIFQMPYAQVAGFDCGSRGHPGFPDQEAQAVSKPLLSTAILAIEAQSDGAIRYNIEIKSRDGGDSVLHPDVAEYTALVLSVVDRAGIVERVTVQSFDPRTLEVLHATRPEVTNAFLVSNKDGLAVNLERLTFLPDTYSPTQSLVDEGLVREVHAMGMTLIPWTVNDVGAMRDLLRLGVDGLITDFPNLAQALRAESSN